MGTHTKPDISRLIASIGQMALLPNMKNGQTKFNRIQLTELYVYIRELKKSRDELLTKIEEGIRENTCQTLQK